MRPNLGKHGQTSESDRRRAGHGRPRARQAELGMIVRHRVFEWDSSIPPPPPPISPAVALFADNRGMLRSWAPSVCPDALLGTVARAALPADIATDTVGARTASGTGTATRCSPCRCFFDGGCCRAWGACADCDPPLPVPTPGSELPRRLRHAVAAAAPASADPHRGRGREAAAGRGRQSFDTYRGSSCARHGSHRQEAHVSEHDIGWRGCPCSVKSDWFAVGGPPRGIATVRVAQSPTCGIVCMSLLECCVFVLWSWSWCVCVCVRKYFLD